MLYEGDGRITQDNDLGVLRDEVERQRAVDRSHILSRRKDPRLQDIVERAARRSSTDIAAISIIDRNRQWFAARIGLEPEETPRSMSFCAIAIQRPGEPLVVLDALLDDRFSQNPLVRSTPRIRFYAGVPLTDPAGYPLGALCIIDSQPRTDVPDLTELRLLALEAEMAIRN